MEIAIKNEKEVTAEDIINEAKTIFTKVQSLAEKTPDEQIIDQIKKEHPDFTKTYFIVLYCMVVLKLFNTNALRKYLDSLKKGWKTQDDFIESQVEYFVILYKMVHRNWSSIEVTKMRNSMIETLKAQHEAFISQYKKLEEAYDEKEKIYKQRNKEELYRCLKAGVVSQQVVVETEENNIKRGNLDLDNM